MQMYNQQYINIAEEILKNGHQRTTRSGLVRSLPFQDLTFDMRWQDFPLLTSRKMYYKGVLGEYAAMIRQPKNIKDFQKWGCNYWNEFGDPDTGDLRLDYGNSWFNYNGVDQVTQLIDNLRVDPYGRRHIINAWKPDNLENLTLPCCHLMYQFYVDEEPGANCAERTLSMMMYQRSGDWMVGVPSDMIFGATMLACFADMINAKAGTLKLVIADAHIYSDHFNNAWKQIENGYVHIDPNYSLEPQDSFKPNSFKPEDLQIHNYSYKGAIKYDLKK